METQKETTQTSEPRKSDVIAELEQQYTVSVRIGQHTLVSDEPEIMGGANLGPSPYELVMAGLGACTAMTLRMYAQRKDWRLKGVSVYLSHNKVHAEECLNCMESGSAKEDVFERLIVLEGELSDEQRTRLLEIANKCPVHNTLVSSSRVHTTLVE